MAKLQRWRCLVCGFVAKGDEPPKDCPACGAGAEQFVRSEFAALGFLADIVNAFAPHPVAVHFSSGLIPVSAFFLVLWFVTGNTSFETASFYTLCISVLSLHIALVTGVLNWQRNYAGRKLPVFRVKLALSTLLVIAGVGALALRYWQGEPSTFYAFLVGAMLCQVVVLGHMGGKLIFYWKNDLR